MKAEAQQQEKEIGEMSRIHSEQLVTHQERESVLRFEVERLKREVESA